MYALSSNDLIPSTPKKARDSLTSEYSDISEDDSLSYCWEQLPYLALLELFKYLSYQDLLRAGQTCKRWCSISREEILWKELLHNDFNIDDSIGLPPDKQSWFLEYRRLVNHVPVVQSEVLKEHSNEVLHVSFSHDGTLFATCSKDGFVFVWESTYPAKLKYEHDLKAFSWKYTQFSQFNSSDTLLLVSGVHFGTHSTSGEIAVFNLADFSLQCRVVNKPYDIFGAWYNDQHLISGDLAQLAPLISTSLLWLNKASQEPESEYTAVINRLYKFYNINSSSVRAITVANIVTAEDSSGTNSTSNNSNCCCRTKKRKKVERTSESEDPYAATIMYRNEYRVNECLEHAESDKGSMEIDDNEAVEKYLIFTCGTHTYTPHLVGFKRIKPFPFKKVLDPGPSLKERIEERRRKKQLLDSGVVEPSVDWSDYESVKDKFDEPDHFVDLHGHIIGMALSPNHRYLYVNCRPWPVGYDIEDPLDPPPIAQEIDIHVIDMCTLEQVGTMYRSHKAYTSNDECFFIFLDVAHEYVASGAEDSHGYVWDRHYGSCLCKLPHRSVVNSVAFNPKDPQMLVTVSDDFTIKVWRSRNRARELGIDLKVKSKGYEFFPRKKK